MLGARGLCVPVQPLPRAKPSPPCPAVTISCVASNPTTPPPPALVYSSRAPFARAALPPLPPHLEPQVVGLGVGSRHLDELVDAAHRGDVVRDEGLDARVQLHRLSGWEKKSARGEGRQEGLEGRRAWGVGDGQG